MHNEGVLCSALLLAATTQDYGKPPLETLPDLRLKVEGNVRPTPAGLRVLMFLTPDCPIAGRMVPYVAEVARAHADVDFYLVFPAATKSVDSLTWVKRAGLEDRAMIVRNDEVRRRARVDVVPTVILLSRQDSVLYFGRVNDLYRSHTVARPKPERSDLSIAIAESKAGKPVSIRYAPAVGCFLG